MEETSTDVNWFNANPSNSSKHKLVPAEDLPGQRPVFNPDALYYDMSGDKYLIILNHHRFKKTQYFGYKQPSTRNGTENDVNSLERVFRQLQFKVWIHNNLEYFDIIKEIRDVCNMDHSHTSCVCVAILTHGDSGEVYASDRPYILRDITSIFENTTSLTGKPKLFFIQACRGDKIDSGKTVQLDSERSGVFTLPTHADFLMLYSTVEEYLSYRNSEGSFMIQSLCKILQDYGGWDLLHLITLVIRRVAYEYTTFTYDETTNNKKQMPEARFTLTKLLKFSNKV